jgi:O-glycosyl hydrolase
MYRNPLFTTICGSVLFITLFSLEGFSATGTLSTGSTHQTIEGFGGGLMFGVFPSNGPEAMKDEIYDSLFCKADFNVVRIGNFYDPDQELAAQENDTVDFYVGEVPMMLEIQKRWPDIKAFMASWSPPPSIKSNNSIEGKDTTTGEKATLKQSDGSYMYSEYADYWYKLLEFFTDTGITIDWFSIQNEPDWPADWDGCLLLPTESSSAASYGKALDAVYDRCQPLNIPMIGPDMTGISGIDGNSLQDYMNSLNQDKLHAICHHFSMGPTPQA